MGEQRRIPRSRTYKVARIAVGGGRAVINCLVKNLSDSGACLGLDNSADIPDRFNLVFDSGEGSRTCQVIWRKANQVGVEFQ